MGKKLDKFNDYEAFVDKFKPKKTTETATRRPPSTMPCCLMSAAPTIFQSRCGSSVPSIQVETIRRRTIHNPAS